MAAQKQLTLRLEVRNFEEKNKRLQTQITERDEEISRLVAMLGAEPEPH